MGFGGGSSTGLAGASDVGLNAPSANQYLGYNPGTAKWINTPLTGVAALSTGGGAETVQSLGNKTGSTAIDLANGNVFSVTATGNITIAISGATAAKACSFALYVKQNATGGYTITWPQTVKWPGGTVPVTTASANALDIFVLESIDGGATWYGSHVGADYK
jgi:hypothetical protein